MLAQTLRRPMTKVIPRNDLFLEYLLEDSTLGSVIKDTSPFLSNASKIGTAAPGVGKIGNAWSLNATGKILTSRFIPAGPISVGSFVTPVASPSNYILGDGPAAGNTNQSMLAITSNATNFTVYNGNGTTFSTTVFPHGLTAGVRAHVMFTFVGTTLKYYLNGTLMSTNTTTVARSAAPGISGFAFGGTGDYVGLYGNYTYDDCRMYSRELTAAEILLIASQVPKKDSRWNSADKGANAVLSQDDRIVLSTGLGSARGKIPASSGKRMFEFTQMTGVTTMIGVATAAASVANYPGGVTTSWGYFAHDGNKYNNSAAVSYGASWATVGDVIGVVVDFTAGTLSFYKNGVSQGVAFTSMAGLTLFPIGGSGGAAAGGGILNVGESGFAYPVAGAIGWAA